MRVVDFIQAIHDRVDKIAWKAYPSLSGQSFVPAHDKFAARIGDDVVIIEKLAHRNDAYRLTIECGDRRPLKLVVDSDSTQGFMLESLFALARGVTWGEVGTPKMREIVERIDRDAKLDEHDDMHACRKTPWCSVPLQPDQAEHDGPCDTSGHRDDE